jgi:single-strand DNA-binding protein
LVVKYLALPTLAINLTFSIRRLNAMQKVLLIGNLGRDPEVKYSQQGTAIAQFSVATSERWKDKDGELQEHTEWFAVKTFGRQAEIVGEHLHQGSRVYLEGRKRTESWDDKQTGAKHYRDLVYVDRVEFLDSKGSGNGHSDPAETASEETAVTDQDPPF